MNLYRLNLSGNQISDISPMSGLTNLDILDLFSNQISNLSPLSSLTNLQHLDVGNNQISELSPLSGLTNLGALVLFNNQISDLSPLSSLTNLQHLDVGNNQISELIPLSGLTNLGWLNLNDNRINYISPLVNLTDLRLLYLDDNSIQDISQLTGLKMIGDLEDFEHWPVKERDGVRIHLGLSNNQISDISSLVNNNGIGEGDGVDLSGNPLSDEAYNNQIPALQARGVYVFSGTSGEIVSPSLNLETAIREALNILTGPITSEDLAKLTELDASERDISDITVIKLCVNLQTLNLNTNQISDISPLSNLTNLESLDLSSNQISDISSLSGLTNLQWIYLHINQISDLSPLSSLTNLINLNLGDNPISDLSPLSSLTNLISLVMENNQISDLSPLSNLTNLRQIYMYGNQISDLSPLSNLINLHSLNLHNNQISDISPLSNLVNLGDLALIENQISDINALSGLTRINMLQLEWNQISDISPLSSLTNLQGLWLHNNQISDISPLVNLTNLRGLYLDDNQIEDISPLTGLNMIGDWEDWEGWAVVEREGVKIHFGLSNNLISDISPLVSNTGIGEGDGIDLRENSLSTWALTGIQKLQERGVNIQFDVGPIEPVFKYTSGGEFSLSSPAIGKDGTIYIGSMDSFLYAVNPDGTRKWRYRTNGPIWSSPAIGSNGVIYVGSEDGALYAVNPDGSLYWKYLTDGPIWSSPAIGNNGDIYFGSFDNIFYALKPDGTWKWEYEIGTMMISSPSIGYDGSIYFGAFDGNLYALRTSGAFKWSFPIGGEIYSSPAIGEDGTVYIGNNTSLFAVNPDGTQKWDIYFENVVESSPAIGADGTIYIGVDDGYLYAIEPNSGSRIWSFGMGNMIVSSPAIGNDGTIYVGSNDSGLYAVSPQGNEKWRFEADGSIWSSPTIGNNGILYFGCYDWNLYAVDTKTNEGLADSPWPKFRNNTKNSGKAFTESWANLMVTFPDGGENLLPGTDVDITWSFNSVSNVRIEYSVDNGANWNKVIDSIPASDGTYKWTIPQGTDSSECLVLVIDTSDATVKDRSNNPFTISPTAFLTLTSRIGGENLSVGETYNITWNSYSISNIDIKYSTDSGSTWKNIQSSVSAAGGSYTWSIPADYSDDCKIMIADSSDSSIFESSTGAFSILSNEFITITSPKFGDRWTAQSTKEITWEFNGVLNVKIEYSSDNGTTWQSIIASTPAASGSYGWSVPDTEASQCIVRITDTANSDISDDSDRFEIIKPELTISHEPLTSAQENDTITFTAVISSEDTVESVTLFYDITGSRNFSAHEVSMLSADGITYSSTLDVGVFTAYGLEYYILAKDVNNQNTRAPADKGYYSISASVSDMKSTETTAGGSAQDSYRMISFPLMPDPSLDTIEEQLSGLLPDGKTGNDWRLFRYSPGETTPNEYPDIEPFSPGAAFWLISKNNFLFEAPSGSTVSTSGAYTITLKAGWNDIANPWMFDISWDDIENPSGATLSTLYTYNGSWSDPTNPPTTLEAWKGYAVNNMTNMNVVIKLNPTLSESTGKPAVKNDTISWELSVNAFAGKAKDTSNHFGLRKGAMDEWDIYDHIEPPPIGEYVSVAFPHSEWERFPQSYTVDFRPHTSENLSWDFTVTTNISNEKIILEFAGADDLPEGYDYVVIDRTNGNVISLKDDSFSFISGSGITENRFTVAVGGELTRHTREYSTLPGSFITASCYPNPFNPSTTIQYELPEPGQVFFTVFNSLGQMVQKKDMGRKKQGVHSFVYEATEMISGIYFYRIESGDASVTEKMLFMK
ncbi:leucine-rich repeat domain-containing protein [Candidatus Latescibacterota bacterium]